MFYERSNLIKRATMRILLLFIVPCLTFALSDVTYTFPVSTLSVMEIEEEGQTYHYVSLSGCQSYTDIIGAPYLPCKEVSFVIPCNQCVEEVEIVSSDSSLIDGEYNVYPTQPPRKTDGSPPPPFVPPDPLYYYDIYPGKVVEILSDGYRSGFRIVTIRLFPIQYFDQKLTLYTNITISLRLTLTNDLGVQVFRRSRLAQDMVKRTVTSIVENPEEVDGCGPPIEIEDVPVQPFYITPNPSLNGSVVDYVIITDDTLKSEFERLVDWRLQQGLISTITTTSAIAGSYTGRDLPEKIRNYIKDAYAKWGTIFVLLGGDVQYVPARIFAGGYVTDLYYSDLEGSWDDDENNIFGEKPYGPVLTSIYYFEDQCRGWVIGDNEAWRTTDGGVNWRRAYTSDTRLVRITFVNDTLGWIVGYNGIILNTTNGGSSWTEQHRAPQVVFSSVDFLNDTIGYAVGARGSFPYENGVVLKTTNGGANWEALSSPCFDSVTYLQDVTFSDEMTGWVVGYKHNPRKGFILKTTDSGLSWTIQDSRRKFAHFGVAFPDSLKGWVAGDSGKILHTTDGGSTWYEQTSFTIRTLYDIFFVDTSIGWSVGNGGLIIKTTNGGNDWIFQTSIAEGRLNNCTFLNADTGWISGHTGVVLKTTNGGNLWVADTLLFGDASVSEYCPDIWVGRAPSSNTMQAGIFIDKIFSYEKTPPNDHLRKILFMAADLGSYYAQVDKERFQTQTWYINSNLSQCYKWELYSPVSGDSWQGDELLNRDNAILRINEGFHFINHMDHADTYALGTGQRQGGGNIYSTDTDSLSNAPMFSILWTNGCKPGAFQYDAISEHLLNNSNGGCIAFIGNSGYGWASQRVQDYQFFKALFGDTLEYIGDAFSTTQGGEISFGFSTRMNLLGDPAMLVWTDTASTLVAEHPDFIPVEPCTFNVRVYWNNGNDPLPGALVTLLEHVNEIYHIDTTDENGQVSFYIDPKYSGEMAVTVTKRLFKPHCGTCKIGLPSDNGNATAYNQGNRLVRDPNTDRLHLTYQSDARAFYSMSINGGLNWSKSDTIDYGRYPALALGSNSNSELPLSYPWVLYFDRGDFRCAVQRGDGTWKIRTVFGCDDSIDEDASIGPALAMATTITSPSAGPDLAYGVFSDLEHIYFAAFDTVETYVLDTLDIANPGDAVSAPSISVTPKDLLHVVWQRANGEQSRIYYVTTLDGITPDYIRNHGQPRWSDKDPVSYVFGYPTEPASNPSVEAHGEYVYAAWRGPNDEGNPDYGEVWQRRGKIQPGQLPYWNDPRNMSRTPLQESNYPVMSTGRVTAWQEELPDTNWDVYCQIGDDTINLSDSKEPSCFPHINYQSIWIPGNPPELGYFIENIYSIFTERVQPNLYEVKFKKYLYSIQSQPPDEYLKVETGNETASVYCEDRDGYVQWDNYAIDYESDSLKYTIPYLHPRKFYLITARVIHDSIGDWQEKFLAENGVGRTVRFSNSGLETLYFLIRPEDYQNDKKFDLVIDKLLGSYSALEELTVSEVEIDTQRYGGGIQSWYDEDLIVGALTKLYHIAPNPFRRTGRIRYQLAHKSKVNLKIYDIMGRAVRTLENEMKDPGIYEVCWDGKDNRNRILSHGIYFIRLKTDDYTEVKKAVLVK